jgi:hypothetical protein
MGVVGGSLAQTYPGSGGAGYAPSSGQPAGGAYPSYPQRYQQELPYQQQPYGQQPYGQNAYPQQYNPQQYGQQQQPGQQSAAGAQAEAAFRRNLMMHSMGFGGLFGPALKKWVETPSNPPSSGN